MLSEHQTGQMADAVASSWCTEMPKKFVLGCVTPPLAAGVISRNLGHTFLANSVHDCAKKWCRVTFFSPAED